MSGVVEQLVEVDAVNSAPEVREKLSRPLTISEARKVCCVIFSSTGESGWPSAVGADLLGEHLGVAGDDGEGRIDLVRDAGGEQADGGELFDWVSCASSSMRSVMSSIRMMRPTTSKARVSRGAMEMLAVRVSPVGSARRNL